MSVGPRKEESKKQTIDVRFSRLCWELQNKIKAESTAQGGPFSYKYADLTTLLPLARTLFARHGFTFSQRSIITANERVVIQTAIKDTETDSKENYIVSDLIVPDVPSNAKNPAQELGKYITYTRRYALYIAMNILPEKDTDAN